MKYKRNLEACLDRNPLQKRVRNTDLSNPENCDCFIKYLEILSKKHKCLAAFLKKFKKWTSEKNYTQIEALCNDMSSNPDPKMPISIIALVKKIPLSFIENLPTLDISDNLKGDLFDCEEFGVFVDKIADFSEIYDEPDFKEFAEKIRDFKDVLDPIKHMANLEKVSSLCEKYSKKIQPSNKKLIKQINNLKTSLFHAVPQKIIDSIDNKVTAFRNFTKAKADKYNRKDDEMYVNCFGKRNILSSALVNDAACFVGTWKWQSPPSSITIYDHIMNFKKINIQSEIYKRFLDELAELILSLKNGRKLPLEFLDIKKYENEMLQLEEDIKNEQERLRSLVTSKTSEKDETEKTEEKEENKEEVVPVEDLLKPHKLLEYVHNEIQKILNTLGVTKGRSVTLYETKLLDFMKQFCSKFKNLKNKSGLISETKIKSNCELLKQQLEKNWGSPKTNTVLIMSTF
ncbi:hypothetical protein FACS189465_2990 [Clostridia bacterium]|nr:hypothetical protein FACS189465_2990 [Clostridia bacterium]